ncbi:MAG: DNA polymerase III subunit gamma/tau [Clostridia bacterium]|nr:DNA polymerase III subunit gamma/tau [Clostridia bacterium]
MSFVALYRRYRPTSFDNLIGQEHITKTLINQIESGRVGHAYLFTGTRGTGKTSCAKIFAKAVNCERPVNGSPCYKCASCVALSDSSNIDIIEIDAASNNGVNEIRDLRENIQYPPVSAKYKVYIIDEVHMLTGAAFNALLKTLEEPPKHAIFILATTEVHKIPATILSRCMRFDFRLIKVEEIAKLISKIYDEEGKAYEKEAVNAIAVAGEGSVRDALSIADTALSYSNGTLTYADVQEILGSCNGEMLYSFVKNLFEGNAGNVLSDVDKLCSLGKSIGVLTKDIIKYVRNVLVAKTCKNANGILVLSEDRFNELKTLSDGVSENRLIRTLEIFTDMESNIRYSLNPRVIFETAVIKATRPDADYDIGALLSRINDLEGKLQKGEFILTEKKEDKPTEKLKIDIEKCSVDDVKTKLLIGLRENRYEMLWNLMQNTKLEKKGNILSIITFGVGDDEIIDREDNRAIISDILGEFTPFTLIVKKSAEEQTLNKVDEATENARRIFGDDIVIVKD